MLWSDHENAVASTTADQLREDHADLKGLAQTNGVGDEDAGAKVIVRKRLAHGSELVVQRIHEHLLRDGELLLVQRNRRLPQGCLQPKSRGPVPR